MQKFFTFFSSTQFIALAVSALLISGLSAFRGVNTLENQGRAADLDLNKLSAIEFVDLSDAVNLLIENGFITRPFQNGVPDNTHSFASVVLSSDSSTEQPLPELSAIVRTEGRWMAYFRVETGVQVSAVGDGVGDWIVSKISQGAVHLVSESDIHVIDVFGAKENNTSEN